METGILAVDLNIAQVDWNTVQSNQLSVVSLDRIGENWYKGVLSQKKAEGSLVMFVESLKRSAESFLVMFAECLKRAARSYLVIFAESLRRFAESFSYIVVAVR